MNRRTLFHWHSWIGLTGGLMLFVICWSGTVAVFSRDLDHLLDGRLSAPATETVAWQPIYEKAQERFPAWTISQVNAPLAPGYAAETVAEDADGVMRRIYSDPATGEIVGSTSYFNIQRFFRSFHMSLFIGELPIWGIPLGYLIVALFSFALLASGITSLLFYRRFWRGFFRLELRKGRKVFWSDFHKLTGLWGLWFLLVIGLTGVWYLIEWKAPDGPTAPEVVLLSSSQPRPVGELVQAAQAAYPELWIRAVSTYSLSEGVFEVQGQDGSLLVRDRAAKAWVNAITGEALGVQKPAEMSVYDRWIDTADPLHFGDFGGLWSKSVWFIFGLALSGLSLSGAYLQVKRQERQKVRHRRAGVVAAYVTTVGLMLLSGFYGLKEAAGYGTNGQLPALTSGQLAILSVWTFSTVGALTAWVWKVR